MPKESPKGGKYVLTGISFRQPRKGGGWVKYVQGDVVTLSDEDAARLCSGKYVSFKPLSEADDDEINEDQDTSTTTKIPQFTNTSNK